jgi:hypothetical protein
MNDDAVPHLDAEDVLRIAREGWGRPPCEQCAGLRCAGWESTPSTLDESLLRRVGTLARPGDDEPTLDEHHPAGTHYWSPDAPIAPRHFPYNRSEVWQCVRCARAFLRYTEYGGYYVDHRIRALDPGLVVTAR